MFNIWVTVIIRADSLQTSLLLPASSILFILSVSLFSSTPLPFNSFIPFDSNYTSCSPSIRWDRTPSVFTFTHRWVQTQNGWYHCLLSVSPPVFDTTSDWQPVSSGQDSQNSHESHQIPNPMNAGAALIEKYLQLLIFINYYLLKTYSKTCLHFPFQIYLQFTKCCHCLTAVHILCLIFCPDTFGSQVSGFLWHFLQDSLQKSKLGKYILLNTYFLLDLSN